VLTVIISLVSLGTGNMLHISKVAWAINIIEINGSEERLEDLIAEMQVK
jgi:hypothetical protein